MSVRIALLMGVVLLLVVLHYLFKDLTTYHSKVTPVTTTELQ